ncbi:hypothetical protein N7492_003254 [Penicillium capsulatum]|uniref:Zn(2)-C6 fungal-type domain-containing protein n=1 Tax=Penicillium capsulatum TaxID=69766 RepID=A0A9W9IJ88_9EURO|nr:hypothetical protein N7492_003254 [Penicillium capsulatum]
MLLPRCSRCVQYPPATYPPPPDHDRPYYPPPQYPPPANMAAIHPHAQGQDPYRLPPPPGSYRPDVYAQAMPGPYSAAAPRQRTAIACRYCRRRKIRCSGFESSQDGRCSNCIRFNQECMFTPVSSQAQAFVPAHAAYPHLRNAPGGAPGGPPRPGVTLYGAHGQPLPAQHQPGAEALPPPPGMHGHYGGAPPLAPHMPDPRQPGARRGSGSAFDYPDPPNLAPVTPTGVAPGYQTHTAAPHYPPPHDRRTSPQMAYAYEARHSSSPNGSPYPPLQAPAGGATPPPSSTPGSSRSGMGLRDMLNHDNPGRTNTDNDMLNALNRGRH